MVKRAVVTSKRQSAKRATGGLRHPSVGRGRKFDAYRVLSVTPPGFLDSVNNWISKAQVVEAQWGMSKTIWVLRGGAVEMNARMRNTYVRRGHKALAIASETSLDQLKLRAKTDVFTVTTFSQFLNSESRQGSTFVYMDVPNRTYVVLRGEGSSEDEESEARIRRAQERLNRIKDIKAAERLSRRGKSQRDIAETLQTTQPRVHRMLRAANSVAQEKSTPEELILRATVQSTRRDRLIRELLAFPYTFREYAPEPFEGSRPGTWDQVKDAYADGFLSRKEFERVRAGVQPPAA